MKKINLRKLTLAYFFLISLPASAWAFDIYQFLPFQKFINNQNITSFKDAGITKDLWLDSLGIKTAHVVYKALDEDELEKVARAAQRGSIISLDLEQWKFGDPKTPSLIKDAIDTMRRHNPRVPVGVYGVAPLNTYGWKQNTTDAKHDALNRRYQSVADSVDFLSPVLYSYQPEMELWEKAAKYNIEAARAYGTNKRIIPYISITVRGLDEISREITYEEMMNELKTLKKLGASGALVWAGSKESTAPLDSINTGWLRAMIEFAAANP